MATDPYATADDEDDTDYQAALRLLHNLAGGYGKDGQYARKLLEWVAQLLDLEAIT